MGYKLFCDNAKFNTIGRQTSNAISGESPYGTPQLIMLQSTSCGYNNCTLTQKHAAVAVNSRKLTRAHTGAIGFKGRKKFRAHTGAIKVKVFNLPLNNLTANILGSINSRTTPLQSNPGHIQQQQYTKCAELNCISISLTWETTNNESIIQNQICSSQNSANSAT